MDFDTFLDIDDPFHRGTSFNDPIVSSFAKDAEAPNLDSSHWNASQSPLSEVASDLWPNDSSAPYRLPESWSQAIDSLLSQSAGHMSDASYSREDTTMQYASTNSSASLNLSYQNTPTNTSSDPTWKQESVLSSSTSDPFELFPDLHGEQQSPEAKFLLYSASPPNNEDTQQSSTPLSEGGVSGGASDASPTPLGCIAPGDLALRRSNITKPTQRTHYNASLSLPHPFTPSRPHIQIPPIAPPMPSRGTAQQPPVTRRLTGWAPTDAENLAQMPSSLAGLKPPCPQPSSARLRVQNTGAAPSTVDPNVIPTSAPFMDLTSFSLASANTTTTTTPRRVRTRALSKAPTSTSTIPTPTEPTRAKRRRTSGQSEYDENDQEDIEEDEDDEEPSDNSSDESDVYQPSSSPVHSSPPSRHTSPYAFNIQSHHRRSGGGAGGVDAFAYPQSSGASASAAYRAVPFNNNSSFARNTGTRLHPLPIPIPPPPPAPSHSRRGKGKAKGSAALALAVVTQMSALQKQQQQREQAEKERARARARARDRHLNGLGSYYDREDDDEGSRDIEQSLENARANDANDGRFSLNGNDMIGTTSETGGNTSLSATVFKELSHLRSATSTSSSSSHPSPHVAVPGPLSAALAATVAIRPGRKRKNSTIPLPIPVPHLIKKSRGRKVPSTFVVPSADGSSSSSDNNNNNNNNANTFNSFGGDIGGSSSLSLSSPTQASPSTAAPMMGTPSVMMHHHPSAGSMVLPAPARPSLTLGCLDVLGPEGAKSVLMSNESTVGTRSTSISTIRTRRGKAGAGSGGSKSGPSVNDEGGSGGAGGVVGKRAYMCEVPGCGKCFVRGEHLKRHVRSIHTYDKPHPCPYHGCEKTFSRRDNLGQHVRIHLQV